MQGEIDWLRIGERGDDTTGYAAPTLSNIVGDVVLNGAPKRALVLNPPSTLRCWLRPAADARLKVALGFWGVGKGTAEVRVVADGEEPVVLQTRRVAGGDSASWTPLAVDLAPFAGKVIGVEFRALDGSRGGTRGLRRSEYCSSSGAADRDSAGKIRHSVAGSGHRPAPRPTLRSDRQARFAG
ncbi:MAG: hypothetical protein WDO74_24950 [Pseudomonadota bacterium]